MADEKRKIPPEVLSRIAALKIEAQRAADGLLTGAHASIFQGASVEFAQHKEYVPGDDIRYLDWRVLAKSDRYYIKKFDLEKNIRALFFVDASASMDYRSHALSKLDYASRMALGLAYLLLKQADQAGLTVCSGRGVSVVPPSSQISHFDLLAETLARTPCEGSAALEAWIQGMSDRISGSGMCLFFSDFFFDESVVRAALKTLKAFRKDVLLFHVLDPAELRFPFSLRTKFKDMESAREIIAEPAAVKSGYLALLTGYIEALRHACLEYGMDYCLCDTGVPLHIQLMKFLKQRSDRA